MADDKEKLYELKQNDELLGKRGRMISDRIYNILPQESKDKFKEITSNRKSRPFIPTTNNIIASINILTTMNTTADVLVNPFDEDNEFDSEDEEETDFDSEDENDIDF